MTQQQTDQQSISQVIHLHTEDKSTFPVQVTAHTFQLALEILKVEALEIRAGRPAREAIEVAEILLHRPNRLAVVTDTDSACVSAPRLDTLSHQFFTLDRTKKYLHRYAIVAPIVAPTSL